MRFFPKPKIYYQGPKSDHFDGERFFNPWNSQLTPFHKVILWKLGSRGKSWKKKHKKIHSDTPPERVQGNQLRVSFVGHSTMLIQTQGLNILTDPIWSKRASPFKFFGPARYSNPGISFEKLPPIDFILVSHNHYDHMDIRTLKKIGHRDHSRIITPLGNDVVIHAEAPYLHVETLDWQQSISIQSKTAASNDEMTIHLLPTQHWSARGVLDRNKALWGAFVIETEGGNIFFCGDSGYGNGEIFRNALKQFGTFRFAMIPIGAYEPRWFMKYAHMNPHDAVLAYKDLGAPYSAAIHFETFKLTDEGFDEPRVRLAEACEKEHADPQRFRALKIGEAWLVPGD